MVEKIAATGDSVAAEHTGPTKCTATVVEPFSSNYTVVVAQTTIVVVVVQTASAIAAAVRTEVEVLAAPPTSVVAIPPNDPLPSHSMSHMFSPRVGHMRDNLYLHAQHIDIMCSIGLSASSPSSACIRISHVDAHILDKCGTMVHCHNSMGSALLTIGSFGNLGNYP